MMYTEFGNPVPIWPYTYPGYPTYPNPWADYSCCPCCGRPWTEYTVSTVELDDDDDAAEKLAAIEKAAIKFKNGNIVYDPDDYEVITEMSKDGSSCSITYRKRGWKPRFYVDEPVSDEKWLKFIMEAYGDEDNGEEEYDETQEEYDETQEPWYRESLDKSKPRHNYST